MGASVDVWREARMVSRSNQADLRSRRQALGISAADMANGTGLPPPRVAEIEEGGASDASRKLYAIWLDIIERWPVAERRLQFRRATEGNLFSRDR